VFRAETNAVNSSIDALLTVKFLELQSEVSKGHDGLGSAIFCVLSISKEHNKELRPFCSIRYDLFDIVIANHKVCDAICFLFVDLYLHLISCFDKLLSQFIVVKDRVDSFIWWSILVIEYDFGDVMHCDFKCSEGFSMHRTTFVVEQHQVLAIGCFTTWIKRVYQFFVLTSCQFTFELSINILFLFCFILNLILRVIWQIVNNKVLELKIKRFHFILIDVNQSYSILFKIKPIKFH